MLFAQDSDTDLDFDEGFEEDELHQSKPPSHRPLLWIILLVLVGAIAYWTFNDPSPQRPRTAAIESLEGTDSALQVDAHMDIASPLFREDQAVILADETGQAMLMGDATNSQPGPLVKGSEHLTILDGSHQITGWVYEVKTASGKTGWVSEDKLKQPS